MAVNALTPEQIAAQKAQSAQPNQPGQTIGTAAPAGQGPAGTPMAKQQATSLANPQQGSGRFTNIQKYLDANKAGGKNIASQVGQGLNKQYTQQSDQAKKYYTQLGQNIQNANQVAQQGIGFQDKLKGIGSQIGQQTLQAVPQEGTPEEQAAIKAANDQRFQAWQTNQAQPLQQIEAFTEDPNFNQFQNIQAGRGIDENLLSLQQQRSAQAAQAAAQGTQQAQQALGSEGGRFELLRKTLGANPGYTTGQQRLDQALLGQGGGLGSVQSQVSQQAREAAQKAKLAGSRVSDVNRLTSQEQSIIGDINKQARANEQDYMKMLGSYIDPFNQQRQQEYTSAEERFKGLQESLKPKVTSGTGISSGTQQKVTGTVESPKPIMTSQDLAQLGVSGPTRAYNLFNDINFQDVANRGVDATKASQLANQQDLGRYQALAKIMGRSPEEQQITQAGNLGNAWAGKEIGKGEALTERIADRAKTFEEDAAAKHLFAGYDWRKGIPSRGSGMQSNLNLVGASSGVSNLLDKGQTGIDSKTYSSDYGYNNAGFLERFRTARKSEVWQQLGDYLKNQGYQNVIGGEMQPQTDAEKQIQQLLNLEKMPVVK